MGMIKKSITVTDQQDAWIKSRIESGQYGNDSELVRDLIRQEQTRSSEIETIRAALIEAERFGMSERNPEAIRNYVQKRMKRNGQL